ncbi:hypothetical protein IEO21_06290 [Rhodonia placenta]|uniref:Uncharacterized protein n=1 Tax=Rhodonia placenta TaxID=104341 RepID=A0A8H7P0C4_9APHY|nr:hypothetical protein IEO21_06290 [Postia placenta]
MVVATSSDFTTVCIPLPRRACPPLLDLLEHWNNEEADVLFESSCERPSSHQDDADREPALSLEQYKQEVVMRLTGQITSKLRCLRSMLKHTDLSWEKHNALDRFALELDDTLRALRTSVTIHVTEDDSDDSSELDLHDAINIAVNGAEVIPTRNLVSCSTSTPNQEYDSTKVATTEGVHLCKPDALHEERTGNVRTGFKERWLSSTPHLARLEEGQAREPRERVLRGSATPGKRTLRIGRGRSRTAKFHKALQDASRLHV